MLPGLALLAIVAVQQVEPSGLRLVESRPVGTDLPSAAHVESYIAADARDARHLIATSMVSIDGKMRSYPYYTLDGGRSWARGRFVGDSGIMSEGDPVVYITRRGTAFYSALGTQAGIRRALVSRSTDGGRTWRTTVLPYADRQWLAFDEGNGPFGG